MYGTDRTVVILNRIFGGHPLKITDIEVVIRRNKN